MRKVSLFFALALSFLLENCAGATGEIRKTTVQTALNGEWYLLEGSKIVRWNFGEDGIVRFPDALSDFASHEAKKAFTPCSNWTWGQMPDSQDESQAAEVYTFKCDRVLFKVLINPPEAKNQYFGIAREGLGAIQFLRFVDTAYDGTILYDFPFARKSSELEALINSVKKENLPFRRILDNYSSDLVDDHNSNLLTRRKAYQKLAKVIRAERVLASSDDCRFFKVSDRELTFGCYYTPIDSESVIGLHFLDRVRIRIAAKSDRRGGMATADSLVEKFETLCATDPNVKFLRYPSPSKFKACAQFSGKIKLNPGSMKVEVVENSSLPAIIVESQIENLAN